MHGAKEFFLHLFTITVGLLIATQIESCMEWRHHVHVADEARASLREEIEKNLADLKLAAPSLQAWRKEVADDLSAMAKIQDNPKDKDAQSASMSVNSHGITLRNTAWKTAETTGALAYMPYEEAQRYARIYQAQADLLALQDKPTEDVARIFGLIAKFNMAGNKAFSADEASELAERLGEMQLHLAAGSAFLKENIEVNSAFLEGREAKGDFSEQLK
jgi:hypothetical protein